MAFEDIQQDFAALDDWEDRYRYIIELGRALPPMPDALKTEATKVRGCASQVWLHATCGDGANGQAGVFAFQGDSDALIVRGLVAILFALYQGKTAAEILAINPMAAFSGLGLKDHLSPQRSNGLSSMVERVRSYALEPGSSGNAFSGA